MTETIQPCSFDESTGLPRDVLQVRTFGVCFYVLRSGDELFLIDGGFPGDWYLDRALRRRGWDHLPVRGILVTHGHLDHILNIQRLAQRFGAWIAAPRLDLPHYEGTPRYHGAARVTGILEAIGRPLLGFRLFSPDRLLDDGDSIDIWEGLTVVHLPGHTEGHSGFYVPNRGLLFCADLFASFAVGSHFPTAIFNHDGKLVRESAARVLDLQPAGLLPNHADRSSPQIHLKRLETLCSKAHFAASR